MKRIRWKLIDKWWPDGREYRPGVRAAKAGGCNACGQCCALIVIGSDQEYMREWNYTTRVWTPSHGKVLSPASRRSVRDYTFLMKHWVRVPRHLAAERGFVKEVDSTNFIYHCLLLTKNGKCSAHDGFRPKVCEDFPFYDGAKFPGNEPFKPHVRFGCGFADRRFK